jgi:hypothetical protein
MIYITENKIPAGDGWMSGERAAMKIGLFIPRRVDAFFPEVGIATLQLLERPGCSVEYRWIRSVADNQWLMAVARKSLLPLRLLRLHTMSWIMI